MKFPRQSVSFSHSGMPDPVRRRLLRYGVNSLGMIAAGHLLAACRYDELPASELRIIPRELGESGVAELRVPEGFSARVIARSSEPVAGSGFIWHAAPDGGATFATDDGGWIYVSNSEMDNGAGGVSAARFDARGNIVDAYPILAGTDRNCAGGPTPWNTWLSCEEVTAGHVWECDPHGEQAARELPALGAFVHEAVAVDPQTLQLYMTEDMRDGRFYRFTPAAASNGVPDLTRGVLEAAEAASPTGGRVTWHVIGDPSAATTPTRLQAAASTAFAGGEGAWYADEMIYFTTKHDNRVWAYNIGAQQLDLVYDGSRHDPLLNGVDNVTVAQNGTVYVAEDGGNMQIVGIDPGQRIFPVVQVIGHQASEVTGPAFDPSGTRLYFSSQRGSSGSPLAGVTYEVTGPFDQM